MGLKRTFLDYFFLRKLIVSNHNLVAITASNKNPRIDATIYNFIL